MRVLRSWKLMVPALLLAACSGGNDEKPEPAPPQKTVFDPMTQQIERAKQVQGTVDQNQADTRKQVESAENGESAK